MGINDCRAGVSKAQAAGTLAVASLTNLGCYAAGGSVLIPPAFGSHGTLGPNVFRSMPYYNWDFSVTKTWKFKDDPRVQAPPFSIASTFPLGVVSATKRSTGSTTEDPSGNRRIEIFRPGG